MTSIHRGDLEIALSGNLPAVGTAAPEFTLTTGDLEEITLADFAGKRVVLNIFPSLDTDTCARSVREFNKRAASLDNTVVLCVSADLPFAAHRFCTVEGIENVITGSTFRSSFSVDYGVRMQTLPFTGLNARAVVIIDTDGKVMYTQLVPEMADEPDYDDALAVLQ
ncbi:putative thiol peroxidase [Galliscardovia ingluviei]|uniref:Thiol peroxidase n=1 Tax=Galliscardovia ingluviei TaxID=1769422 RepID=A0A8J3EZ80_9BIFI|nr:thiol peroxidase [Galliscardovia ingluviei]GGI15007.1 putative thiol peroxidase [Galliscardovia ingluviei]